MHRWKGMAESPSQKPATKDSVCNWDSKICRLGLHAFEDLGLNCLLSLGLHADNLSRR